MCSSLNDNFGSQRDNRLGRENAYKTSETLCFWGFSLPSNPYGMSRNVVEICGYVVRMHQKSQQLCGQMLLSILSFSHNFVYGIDQNPDIKMSVDTFCKRHSSRMSNNLLDGSFINAVFFHHGNCSVARTVWRPLNSNSCCKWSLLSEWEV